MLTYEEALARIRRVTPPPRTARVPLARALGLTLARGVRAAVDVPPFDNSAVDGYAVCLPEGLTLSVRVVGRAEAGHPFRGRVQPGEAVRILTGAMVPPGTTSVVMQERVTCLGHDVELDEPPRPGQHIRRRGEDVRRGKTLLAAGAVLRPQELALLASAGVGRVWAHRPPTAAVLSTGDELQPPGRRLRPGAIYECNGLLLAGLARRAGAKPRRLGTVRDRLPALIRALRRAGGDDLVVISGGVSVGDKDFVRDAAARCGWRPVLWKVDIKPGMPLFVAARGRRLLFGLPGNPVSVFVTFEEFVKPVIRRLTGQAWSDGYRSPATLTQPLRLSATRRTHFVRVRSSARPGGGLRVQPLNGQGAHQLRSLVEAEGWLRLTARKGPWPMGTPVLVKQEERAW